MIATAYSKSEIGKSLGKLKLLEQRYCPACGAADAQTIANGEDFEYQTSDDVYRVQCCDACGLLYLAERPAATELDRIYPPTYHAFQFSAEAFGLAYRVRRKLEARRLLACCADLKPGARILDAGCGDGFHLDLLRESGDRSWTLEGLDASEAAVRAARRKGLTVHCGTLEACALPAEAYDCIFLIATIEHVPDPRAMLEAARRLLKPGGKAVIVTDNTATLDRRLFGERWWGGYHFPRHFQLFNEHNLMALGFAAGLEPRRVETLLSPVNWVYSIRNYLQDRGASPRLYRQFSLSGAIPLAIFTIIDGLFQLRGQGALLRVTFRKQQQTSKRGTL